MRILLSGSTGFIGSSLSAFLREKGNEVVPLVRKKGEEGIFWDPAAKKTDSALFEGFDVVIHLCGADIASKRWTKRRKKLLFASRVESTQFLTKVLLSLRSPPKTVISISGVGYYGNCVQEVDETGERGKGFLADLCVAWEAAAEPLRGKGIRVVHPRLGVVLSPKGGALASLLPLFRRGFGARLGDGKQMMSWIALEDVLGGIYHILTHLELSGALNFTAPESVTNREFTQNLAEKVGGKVFFSLPKWFLYLLLGERAKELFLFNIAVFPKSLLQTGYRFGYDRIKLYLRYTDAKRNTRG